MVLNLLEAEPNASVRAETLDRYADCSPMQAAVQSGHVAFFGGRGAARWGLPQKKKSQYNVNRKPVRRRSEAMMKATTQEKVVLIWRF